MLTLSSTLEAAQAANSGRPYVYATLSDAYGGNVERARFSRYYTGSEGDYYGAVVVAGDGSLVRARIDPTTKVLYTQRVTSPGSGSTYSSWTSHGTVSASGAVALAADGDDVWLFYVDTDTTTIKVKASSDDGASWGSAATVASAAAAVTYLACAIADDGDQVLFWTVGAVVWASRYTSSSWQTPASWSNTMDTITGLACDYYLDFGVVVAGTEDTTTDPVVMGALYGDGNDAVADSWGNLNEVTRATAGSGVSFKLPALQWYDYGWRLFFVESYSGNVAYTRLQWTTMAIENNLAQEDWREPAVFDYTGGYGVAAARASAGMWLSSPAGVWYSPLPGLAELDVSADVLEVEVDIEERGGRARLTLRNDDGRYSPGQVDQVARGMRIKLAPGYYTSAGAEAVTGYAQEFWVEAVEYVTGPRPRVVLHGRDGWWLLERWRARRQLAWAYGDLNVFQLVRRVAARAGVLMTTSGGSTWLGNFQPAFTVQPRESGETAMRRLLQLVADGGRFRAQKLVLTELASDDASVYAYGGDGEHAIVRGRYRDAGPRFNRVQVIGDAYFDEAFDLDDAEAVGERLDQVHTLNAPDGTTVAALAAIALRDAQIHQVDDELEIFGVNCGQELHDVVTVTDVAAGLDAVDRRVLGLSWRYGGAERLRYAMTLRLGAV